MKFLFLVTRPHTFCNCVKSSLCIATIYKAPRLLTEHNNKLCNVLAFVVYRSCENEIMSTEKHCPAHHGKRQSVTSNKFSTNSGLIILNAVHTWYDDFCETVIYNYYTAAPSSRVRNSQLDATTEQNADLDPELLEPRTTSTPGLSKHLLVP